MESFKVIERERKGRQKRKQRWEWSREKSDGVGVLFVRDPIHGIMISFVLDESSDPAISS